MNTVYRDNIFFLICCCLPFLFVPKILQLNFLGGPIGSQLIIWPTLIAYIYMLFIVKKGDKIFADLNKFLLFLIIYTGINLVSLFYGLYVYPYWDIIINGPANQIEKLSIVLSFLHTNSIMIRQEVLLNIWIICRFFKAIIFECLYTFGFSYLIYCWFKKDATRAICILQHSIYIITCIIGIYSFFELNYFWGNKWAENILTTVNPMLHAIKENYGWWPPLLWDSMRIRSIFPEPSQFGMYATFVIPFFCLSIFDKIKINKNLFFLSLTVFLLLLSLSKTSNILFCIEMILICILAIINKEIFKKFLLIIVAVIIAIGASMGCLFSYESQVVSATSRVKQEQNRESNIAHEYVKDNVAGVADPNSGSNSARFAIIKSDLRIFSDNILLGVGSGLKSAYTADYLTDQEKNNGEIAAWGKLQKENGVLKSGYPSVCEFSKRLAENGIIGFSLYIFPLLILFKKILNKRHLLLKNKIKLNTLACTLISLIISFGAGGSGILTTIHTYWLLLGISFALVNSNDYERKIE